IGDVKFEGFDLKRPPVKVEDTQVDEQIEMLRQRHAALKAPEPARASGKGDVVTIDFTLSIDGKDIKDGGGQGVQLEVGGGQALPEIDEAINGKNAGDKVEAKHTFPAEHPREDFRGKTGQFAITISDLKERVL